MKMRKRACYLDKEIERRRRKMREMSWGLSKRDRREERRQREKEKMKEK